MSRSMLDRVRGRPLLLGAEGAWDGVRHWPSFQDWCRAHAGQACRLWLGSVWLHELVCADGLPLRDDAAALEWARGMLVHYHGEVAAAWPLASWQQGRRRGVSALHGVPLQALHDGARPCRVQLRAVRPWWSGVLRLALLRQPVLRRGAARLLVVERNRVAVLDLEAGSIEQLQLRRLDGEDAVALEPWEAAGRPTLAIGYGLPGPVPVGIRAPERLDAAGPTPAWT